MRTTSSIYLFNFYFNFYAGSLAPIESSTSILMRTAWHQSKALLQFSCGQLGTNRKFYFNFDAGSLAPIVSSTSNFYDRPVETTGRKNLWRTNKDAKEPLECTRKNGLKKCWKMTELWAFPWKYLWKIVIFGKIFSTLFHFFNIWRSILMF